MKVRNTCISILRKNNRHFLPAKWDNGSLKPKFNTNLG